MNPIRSDLTLGTGKTIGAYFGLVSTIPTLLLAGWAVGLWATGAPASAPRMDLADDRLAAVPLLAWTGVLSAVIAVAVVTHPLQFAAVQFLEGYWGQSSTGRAARRHLTKHHLRRKAHAEHLQRQYRQYLLDIHPTTMTAALKHRDRDVAELALTRQVNQDAATQILARYPSLVAQLLPTTLGNVLRGLELRSGAAVGLPILGFATHIGMVAPPAQTGYVRDQRGQLDLAVRMTYVCATATVLTVLAMWQYGWWLLLALVPYVGAWLSYRGSIVAATSYGAALGAWLDLAKPHLYEALHLDHPRTANEERAQNAQLAAMVAGSDAFSVTYASTTPARSRMLGSRPPSVHRPKPVPQPPLTTTTPAADKH